ncbi:MAG: hypothetical protein H7X80_00370, partial [bacterium]|nr:hypothetical protein [Candidatus Kapabacteria bacterium]
TSDVPRAPIDAVETHDDDVEQLDFINEISEEDFRAEQLSKNRSASATNDSGAKPNDASASDPSGSHSQPTT